MHKLIGVIGASGTGKTTLCEQSGFTFIRTDVSGVYKDFGLNPRDYMSLSSRIKVQERILERHQDIWQEQFEKYKGKEVIFVTDRTPICFMTYLLAEVSGYGKLKDEDELAVQQYLSRCQDTLTWHFDGIFHLIGEGPFKVNENDGKIRASHGLAYHAHYQNLSVGLMLDNMLNGNFMLCEPQKPAERVIALRSFVGRL